MKQSLALFLAVVAVVLMGNWSRSVGQQQAPGNPATDQRFCVDANGDGRLDISDAATILNYLFVGNSTPYCIAQDVSLNQFASNEDLNALKARVEMVEARQATASLVATGSYIGNGANSRLIESALPGEARLVQLWSKPAGERFFSVTGGRVDRMENQNPFGFSLSGSGFVVNATILNDEGAPVDTGTNTEGWEYVWAAFSSGE